MTVTAVVGAQWGDEGKGRIVDYLAQTRRHGDPLPGRRQRRAHGGQRVRHVPAAPRAVGHLQPGHRCIIGTGTVVNPDTLLEEMAQLAAAGVSLDNLWLSERAQVVMPYHRLLDGLEESARGGHRSAPPSAASARPTPTRPPAPASAWAI